MRENIYESKVFLNELLSDPEYKKNRLWREHQEMQFEYVKKAGLEPNHHFLDVACGPLRLGAVLVPYLSNGRYYGMDINENTIRLGVQKLFDDGIDHSNAVFFANDTFDFTPVKSTIKMAFSNSLFSHLTLNSIVLCLVSLHKILPAGAAYHTTFFAISEGADWSEPADRDKWGRDFQTFPTKDPYHYKPSMLANLANQIGYDFAIEQQYGHPTQTMAIFTKRGSSRTMPTL
jgi:SAM-dependent methyltransferase